MRLCTVIHDQTPKFGLIDGDCFVDLTGNTKGWSSIKDVLGKGAEDLRRCASTAARLRIDEVAFLPVVPDPAHVIGVGLNTRSHFEEAKALLKLNQLPTRPWLFLRPATSLAAHQSDLVVPSGSDMLDFEAEIALVIGQKCRNVPRSQAWSKVAGLTCFNDASVRDYQTHSPQVTAGKIFPKTGGIGPWITSSESLPPLDSLELRLALNGEVMQRMKMSDLIFSFEEIVSYVSEVVELQPGDIIATGSPAGVGGLRKPPVWLKPGDTVEVQLDGVGVLINSVSKAEA